MGIDTVQGLSAADARRITKSSEWLLRSIYKWIEEAAKRCNNHIYIYADEFDNEVLENIVQILKMQDYKVTKDLEDEKSITISW